MEAQIEAGRINLDYLDYLMYKKLYNIFIFFELL